MTSTWTMMNCLESAANGRGREHTLRARHLQQPLRRSYAITPRLCFGACGRRLTLTRGDHGGGSGAGGAGGRVDAGDLGDAGDRGDGADGAGIAGGGGEAGLDTRAEHRFGVFGRGGLHRQERVRRT